jgi:hypothetical protein
MLRNIWRMILVAVRLGRVSRKEREICRNLGVSVKEYRKARWRHHWVDRHQVPAGYSAGHLNGALSEDDLEEAYEKFVDALDRQGDAYQFPSERE